MKIVHSYWSKPTRESREDSEEKIFGGWRSKKFMYMSWAYSCLQAKKYYGKVELVTDKAGFDLLINRLQLPYTSVKQELDAFNDYDKRYWAVGKLHAYRIQEAPFLHIDNDVFIGNNFSEELENASLVAQHLEYDIGQYQLGFVDMLQKECLMPQVLLEDQQTYGRIKAINAGIIGGNNLNFIKEYVEKAFRFINSNLDKFGANVAGSSHAIIYEQYLFSAMARAKKEQVSYYYTEEESEEIDISDFFNFYTLKPYVHFIGDAKFFWECCRNLEHHLVQDYPSVYNLIQSLISKESAESSVRKNTLQPFRRTIEFLEYFSGNDTYSIPEFLLKDGVGKIQEWLGQKENQTQLKTVFSEKQFKMFQEIYSIEEEKLSLKNNKEALEGIFKEEIVWNLERDRILNSDFEDIINLTFKMNPNMQIYESYWEWIVRESEFKEFALEEIISEEASDFYFGLERCGTFDAVTDTNIFEFPLTEFQYIVLRLLEEPSVVEEVLQSFYSMFDVTTDLEKKELERKAEKIFRQLIYRRCIVLKK